MSYVERTWKPVKLGSAMMGGNASGTMASVSGEKNWYNNLTNLSTDRKEKIDKYRMMDRSTDIFRALDIIAEDISSENADDNRMFELNFDDAKINNTQLNTITKTLRYWEKKTKFDYLFYDYMREMIKYGCVIFEQNGDNSLNKLSQDRLKGYILDSKDEDEVSHYLYDRQEAIKTDNGEIIQQSKHGSTSSTRELEKLDVKKLLVLKIGDGPFGESVLEKIFKVWRQLQLLEDAVVIYRIVRAPERRVFYIDIGRQPAHKAEKHIEKIKNKMRQKQIMKEDNLETDYNPASMQEDYFIGQSSDGKGSRVESLPGGDNLGRIEDLMFFNKKLALGLRIPPSYLDTYNQDAQSGQIYNDGRLGTAYIAELRYAGYIQRIQKNISKELFTHFRKYCKKQGVELPEEMTFSIAPPQSFAIYKQNELFNALLNTYASAEGMESLSKRESMRRFLEFSEEDLQENEKAKVLELGYSEKEYKAMAPNVVYNVVYGEGNIAPPKEAEADAEGDTGEEDDTGFRI